MAPYRSIALHGWSSEPPTRRHSCNNLAQKRLAFLFD